MIIASTMHYFELHDILLIVETFLQWGARLDAKDAGGRTILDTATRWVVAERFADGVVFDFAPILLQLQRECAIAQET